MKKIALLTIVLPLFWQQGNAQSPGATDYQKVTVTKDEIEDFIRFLVKDGKLLTSQYLSQDIIKDGPEDLIRVLENRTKRKTHMDSVLFEGLTKDGPAISRMYESLASIKIDNKKMGFVSKKNDSYTSVSLPYFTPSKDMVLIKITETCPGLCGSGQIILYEKDHETWRIRKITEWLI